MFTMREVQTNAAIAAAVIFFLIVPLACPLTKAIMDWRDRRKLARPGCEHEQAAGAA